MYCAQIQLVPRQYSALSKTNDRSHFLKDLIKYYSKTKTSAFRRQAQGREYILVFWRQPITFLAAALYQLANAYRHLWRLSCQFCSCMHHFAHTYWCFGGNQSLFQRLHYTYINTSSHTHTGIVAVTRQFCSCMRHFRARSYNIPVCRPLPSSFAFINSQVFCI